MPSRWPAARLIMTPLAGADQTIYAVAQGPITVTGYLAKGAAESVTSEHSNTRADRKWRHRRAGCAGLADDGMPLELQLRNPDFTTATRVMDAINSYAQKRYGLRIARAKDFQDIVLRRPDVDLDVPVVCRARRADGRAGSTGARRYR